MIPNRRAATDAAVAWWRGLRPDPERRQPGDRAALARLRRCANVAAAMGDPATIALFRQVGATEPRDLPAVALAAAVLAHLREDRRGTPVARAVGPTNPDAPETAVMSPLRFRRLLEAATPDERLTAFRRLVALAGGALDARDLAAALLDWSERRRRDWIYAYWNASPPAGLPTPETAATPAEGTAAA